MNRPILFVAHEILDITSSELISCLSSQAGLRIIVQAGSAVDLGCERTGGEH